jgi:hypothetical protein
MAYHETGRNAPCPRCAPVVDGVELEPGNVHQRGWDEPPYTYGPPDGWDAGGCGEEPWDACDACGAGGTSAPWTADELTHLEASASDWHTYHVGDDR